MINLNFYRKNTIKALGATLMFAAADRALSQDPAHAKSKPNVLFIAVDDLKPTLGCYGDKKAITPNIDALASKGVTFLNNHCQQAVCGPSRTSLLTGMYPDSTRVWDLKTKFRDINPGIVTIPQCFRENGYTTVGIGKVFDIRNTDKGSDSVSWTHRISGVRYCNKHAKRYPGAWKSAEAIAKIDELAKKLGSDYAKISFKERKKLYKQHGINKPVDAADVADEGYIDGGIAKAGLVEIDKLAKAKKPFFLAVGFFKPHLPFSAPKKYWDMYKRDDFKIHPFQQVPKDSARYGYHTSSELRSYAGMPKFKGYDKVGTVDISESQQKELIHGYYACVSYIDAQVGKLMMELKKKGLDKNTIIVLWGDHGWHLGDHGFWCKHSNYEQATRSPMIIAAPGYKEDLKTDDPTGFIDIFPTLCELAGLKVPKQCQGKSLLPELEGNEKPVRKYIISQYPRWGFRHSKDKKVRWGKFMGYSMRTKRYRYTIWFGNRFYSGLPLDEKNIAAEELYDLKKDPMETANLAKNPEYASIHKELFKDMKQFLAGQYSFLKNYFARLNLKPEWIKPVNLEEKVKP